MSPETASVDRKFMLRALELAKKGLYSVSPNPMVGAVLVIDGEIIGEGWHERAGEAHAEILALDSVSRDPRQSTLYVTLEPCRHHGRTPPCVDRILQSGVARVVIATEDPSEAMSGASIRQLEEQGLDVTTGICRDEAERLNEVFLRSVTSGRPFIAIKAAMTLDGKMAIESGRSQWITSDAARHRGLELRERYDAILTGSGTVRADDPRLTRRLGLGSSIQKHTRVILDASGTLPLSAGVINDGATPTLVFTPNPDRYESSACEAIEAPAESGRIDLDFVLGDLGRRGIRSLLTEGGPSIIRSFVDSGRWDKIYAFIAPLLAGGSERYGFLSGSVVTDLDQAVRFRFDEIEKIDPDVLLIARPLK